MESKQYSYHAKRNKVVMTVAEYISVYSNSARYLFKRGRGRNKRKPRLVYTSKQEGSTVIDFQLWKSSQKLNPQLWLMKSKFCPKVSVPLSLFIMMFFTNPLTFKLYLSMFCFQLLPLLKAPVRV